MSGGESVRLRVAVYDGGHDRADWASALTPPSSELMRVRSTAELLKAGADYVVASCTASEAAQIAAELAARPQGPTAALLIGPSGTEHPQAQLIRTLAHGKGEWEATFDAIVDPLAILDGTGRVIRANLGLARALGRDIKDTVGVHYAQLLRPVGPDPIRRTLADGVARTEETRFHALPGIQQLTLSPLDLKGENAPGGLVVLIKDLSEQKEQQERILQAARLADIGQLAAGVAHEINTPLASIALRAESLLKTAADPRLREIQAFANFPRYLGTIHEETFRCKKIIGALLEFSSSRRIEKRPTDLNALAAKAAELVEHQMQLKRVELTVELDRTLPPIQADDGQLRQVLISLLMNALDATPPGGHVKVSTNRGDEGEVMLVVSDDGVGIPREIQDKIFNPFFTTKPVGQGTGLGLAICHGIVTSHGGSIRVESEPGKGTRFSALFPQTAV